MATVAAILASANLYVSVRRLGKDDEGRWNDGIVVSGSLGTVAKVDFAEWEHYVPNNYEDTPCYPCEGWQI